MIVLDTNVASELMKASMNSAVLTWLRQQDQSQHCLTSASVMEIWYGAERIYLRSRASRLIEATDNLLNKRFIGRVLIFDATAAALAGRLRAKREASGRAMSIQDAIIAAICLSQGAALATRNVKDFEGLDLHLINPFEEA